MFLDYNQNAKDRTTASAYSVRPLPDARVSAPLRWDEVMACEPGDFTVLTMPERFATIGDPHEAMDESVGSLEALLELAARDEAAGLGDAPWPPHFAKAEGEGKRVTPSRAKKSAADSGGEKSFAHQMGEGFGAQRFRRRSKALEAAPDETAVATGDEENSRSPSGMTTRKTRASKMPLVIVAQSPDQAAAMAGLDRWKARYPEAAARLAVDDVLVDRMRGSSSIWYRIRVNLRHVPEEMRPAQEAPDPDEDPTRAWRE